MRGRLREKGKGKVVQRPGLSTTARVLVFGKTNSHRSPPRQSCANRKDPQLRVRRSQALVVILLASPPDFPPPVDPSAAFPPKNERSPPSRHPLLSLEIRENRGEEVERASLESRAEGHDTPRRRFPVLLESRSVRLRRLRVGGRRSDGCWPSVGAARQRPAKRKVRIASEGGKESGERCSDRTAESCGLKKQESGTARTWRTGSRLTPDDSSATERAQRSSEAVAGPLDAGIFRRRQVSR